MKTFKVLQNSLQVLCYPFFFLSAILTVFFAFEYKLSFSVCTVGFLTWTLVYISLMEHWIPYEPKWHPTKKEWLRDGIYLFLTMLGGGCAIAFVFHIASFFHPLHFKIPLTLEIFLALLLNSLGSYSFHRLSHVHPWLWLVHGIHHVEAKVNVGNNGVNHILDVFFRRVLAQLPIVLLGVSPSTLFVLGIFNTMQGYFSHANIRTEFGCLNYILVSPEQHRLHHSKDMSEAGHYGVDIPLWDLLFKSFTWRPGREALEIGVVNPEKFPSADKIFESFLCPFLKKKKILYKNF